MAVRAQEICMAMGTQRLIAVGGARGIMTKLEASDAPKACDAVYQDAVKLLEYRKTGETTDEFVAHFDFFRKRA